MLPPVGIKNEEKFRKSLDRQDTILITLRVNKDDHYKAGEIMGYVKGGPLENYRLRSVPTTRILGDTILLIWNGLVSSLAFGGENGGHILRLEFLRKQDVVAICMSQVMCTEML